MTDATGSAPVASVATIRSHFPALERRHAGHSVAYFDGPGGTQVPRQVVEAMDDYLLTLASFLEGRSSRNWAAVEPYRPWTSHRTAPGSQPLPQVCSRCGPSS